MQLKPVSYATIIQQPVTVSSNTQCSQTHVQIKHSLEHLKALIPTLAGAVAYMFYTSQSRD